MTRKLFTLLGVICICLVANSVTISAATLHGQLMLNDTLPAQYATVFVRSLGFGAISDASGNYTLEGLPMGNFQVEYSHIGYKPQLIDVNIAEESATLDVAFTEQPVILSDVYITPNGEDPAIYILKNIARVAESNSKSLEYSADVRQSFYAQDLDIIPALLPKAMLWIVRMAMKTAGFAATFDYCTENETVSLEVASTHHRKGKKSKYSDQRILKSNPAPSDKVRKQLLEAADYDLFDDIYEPFIKDAKKGFANTQYVLKGVIEENGKTVDVLERSTDAMSFTFTERLYVVEDDWGILRHELKSNSNFMRIECRDMGNGVYLPISKVNEPKPMDFKTMIEQIKKEDADAADDFDKDSKMAKRINAIINGSREFRPFMMTGFNIRYSVE
ncbi:MAG: carboxypeptidase-like regulatory domain-containing protein [Bacteroidales bacterium]|nr:carboxypeptidase-like regulatory domain-containing protein [Candidatus Liminaster caballi]